MSLRWFVGYVGVGLAAGLVAAIVIRNHGRLVEDRRLDEQLDESFPASDPPSHSSPVGAQAG